MIKQCDIERINEPFVGELNAAVARVIRSGVFVGGPEVRDFEVSWAQRCGADYGVAVSSGTAALHLAMLAMGVGPNSVVAVPAMTWTSTALAAKYCGARVVCVDVDYDTRCVEDWSSVDGNVDLIVPVLLHGRTNVAKPRLSRYLLDCAQAAGYVSLHGETCAWSFYPTKNLGGIGEGGAVTTDDERVYNYCMGARDYFRDSPGGVGYNYRMSSILAAALSVKLGRLIVNNNERAEIAAAYHDGLANVTLPPKGGSVWHQYAILVNDITRFCGAMRARGVETGRHYSFTVNERVRCELGSTWERALYLSRHMVSLPMWPGLDPAPVIDAVRESLR